MQKLRRKKVIKSPAKTSSTQNEGKVDNSYCPCKDYMDVNFLWGVRTVVSTAIFAVLVSKA